MLRYSDIQIICSGCYQSAILFDWSFKCAAHNYRESSKQGWLYALSLLGQQKGNADQIAQAVRQIVKYMWSSDLYSTLFLSYKSSVFAA